MTRDDILSAAKAVADREGIAALTVRKIAARAGLSPAAMYRHFADKDALLNALMDDGLASWEKVVRSLKSRDAMAWLQELTDAYLDFALTQPQRFDAAFFLPAPEARRYPDDFVAGRSPILSMIMLRIDQAKAAGKLVNKPAIDIALALSAMAQGMISMHRANRFASDKQFRTLFRSNLRHCLQSFTAPGE